jgi:CRP-like cAMP-binding protein
MIGKQFLKSVENTLSTKMTSAYWLWNYRNHQQMICRKNQKFDSNYEYNLSNLPVMYNQFFQNFNNKVILTPEEEELIKKYLTLKKLRKRQYLLQEGDVCKSVAFVEKGAVRAYSVDDNGNEGIIQFALEGSTISDLYSFLTGETATYNIDAIEDSELLLIKKPAHEELLQKLPKYETYIRFQLTDAYIEMQKRITSIISLSLEERYAYFRSMYPEIIQRVPQHMIASFMGLAPETLSRVRKRISHK